MATLSKVDGSSYQSSLDGLDGPPNKLYNTDDKLVAPLDISGLTAGVSHDGYELDVLLVTGDFDSAVIASDASQSDYIISDGTPGKITLSGTGAAPVGQGLVELILNKSKLVVAEEAGLRIVVIGAGAPASDALPDTQDGEFVIAELQLGTAGEDIFHVMPGTQYTSDYATDKDPGSRTSRVDTIQVKAPVARRDVAPSGHVSNASGAVYLDEVLDGLAGEIQRMKDVRGGDAWDASASAWHVDSHPMSDGRGRFVIDADSMALEAHGGILSGLMILGDDLPGKIVEFVQQFSSADTVDGNGKFDTPLTYAAAWADSDVRVHLGYLAAQNHPEFASAPEASSSGGDVAAAGSSEAWIVSQISSAWALDDGTGLIEAYDAVETNHIQGTGDKAADSDAMQIPGLLRDLSTVDSGGSDSSGDPAPRLTMPGSSVYVQEVTSGTDSKLDYIRLARDEDAVKILIDANLGGNAIFTDEAGRKGLDLLEAIAEAAASGPDLDLAASSIGDLSDVDDSSPSNGDILSWDGANWAPIAPPSGADGNDYVSNVTFDGTNLQITASGGSAFAGDIDLSSLANDIKLDTSMSDYLHEGRKDSLFIHNDADMMNGLLVEATADGDSGINVVLTDTADTVDGVNDVSFATSTLTIEADFTSGNVDLDAIKAAFDAAAGITEVTMTLEGDGSTAAGVGMVSGSLSGHLAANTLLLVMTDMSEAALDLSELVDVAATNTYVSSGATDVSSPGAEIITLTLSDASEVQIDVSSLVSAGATGEDHIQDEVAISGTVSAGTEVTFSKNIHPVMAADDDQDGDGDPGDAFKDKMAVYRNGIRISRNDYVLVGETAPGDGDNQDKLKFTSDLNDGDYIIVEVKAALV